MNFELMAKEKKYDTVDGRKRPLKELSGLEAWERHYVHIHDPEKKAAFLAGVQHAIDYVRNIQGDEFWED